MIIYAEGKDDLKNKLEALLTLGIYDFKVEIATDKAVIEPPPAVKITYVPYIPSVKYKITINYKEE